MLRKRFGAFAVLVIVVAAVCAADGHLSRLNTWELDFESKPPRVLDVREGDKISQYTYIPYQVTNNTSEDVNFYPTFHIQGEEGEVVRASIYPTVCAQLAKRLGKDVLPSGKVAGIVEPGKTRKSLAVFKDIDADADSLTVYVAGLSGDFKSDKNDQGEHVPMYRTLKLTYSRPGDAGGRRLAIATLVSSEWIWRE